MMRHDVDITYGPHQCPDCNYVMIPPEPLGTPGDDSWYCDRCGQSWSLDLTTRVL